MVIKVRPGTRNDKLANILEPLHVTLDRYSGIPTILCEFENAIMPAPVFELRRGDYIVIFKNNIWRADKRSDENLEEAVLDFCATPRIRTLFEHHILMGERWIERGRLFAKPNGSPIHPDTIRCWFSEFIRVNNLQDISIHSLWHTNATMIINTGIPITDITVRLEHANQTTITRIYTHGIQSEDAIAVAEQLDFIFTSRQAVTGWNIDTN